MARRRGGGVRPVVHAVVSSGCAAAINVATGDPAAVWAWPAVGVLAVTSGLWSWRQARGSNSPAPPNTVENHFSGQAHSVAQFGQNNGTVEFRQEHHEHHHYADDGAVAGPGLGSVAAPTGRLVHAVHGRDDVIAGVTETVRAGRGVAVVHGAGVMARPRSRYRW
jgi:hypothetical protein